MRTTLLRLTPLILVATVFAGCASTGGGQGTVGMAVTDAPADEWRNVNITFSKGSIHKAGGDNESESGWIQIVNSTRTVDLIALHKNNTAEALGFSKVDAGKYTQVRIYVDKAEGVKTDGTHVTFTVPSGVLKTSKSFEVKSGGNTTLTLEIDLEKSINCNNQGCKFMPVLGKVEATEN